MARVIHITEKIFEGIFIRTSFLGGSILNLIINRIIQHPLLSLSAIFLVVGFTVSIIKRLIRS